MRYLKDGVEDIPLFRTPHSLICCDDDRLNTVSLDGSGYGGGAVYGDVGYDPDYIATNTTYVNPTYNTTSAVAASASIVEEQYAVVFDLLSEGEIEGLVNNSKESVKYNLTSIYDEGSSEYIFEHAYTELIKGAPGDLPSNITKPFAGANFLVQLNEEIEWSAGYGGTQAPFNITPTHFGLTNNQAKEVDSVKLSFEFPQGLYAVEKDGEYHGAVAAFKVTLHYLNDVTWSEKVLMGVEPQPPWWYDSTTNSTSYSETYCSSWGGSNGNEYCTSWDTRVVSIDYTKTKSRVIGGDDSSLNIDCYKMPAGYYNYGLSEGVVKREEHSKFSFETVLDISGLNFDDWYLEVIRYTPVTLEDYTGKTTGGGIAAQASISMAEALIKDKFNYPLSAYAISSFSAEDFSSPPSRSYLIRGKKVSVPSNYVTRESIDTSNPLAQQAYYNGFWDGTFAAAKVYTNNPAWVFYDLITNPRYGLGGFIKPDDIDIFALYEISKYCDELVPDGKGGMEPRFTCNLYLSKAEESFKVLNDLASTFRSMIHWIGGKVTAVQDRPKEPLYTFTAGNVIEGNFSYEYTGQQARVNQVNVTWNDPVDNYKQNVLIVDDIDNIIDTGRVVSKSIAAFGTTSEGQARRLGNWHLITNSLETAVCSFQTSINAGFLSPGDLIKVQDSYTTKLAFSGRLSSGSTTSVINLDRSVELQAGQLYYLYIIMEKPGCYLQQDTATIATVVYSRGDLLPWIVTKEEAVKSIDDSSVSVQTSFSAHSRLERRSVITPSGIVNQLTIGEVLSEVPETETIWALSNIYEEQREDTTKTYRVLGVKEDADSIYGITASTYAEEKYEELERGWALSVDPYKETPYDEQVVPMPSDLHFIFKDNGTSFITWVNPIMEELDASGTLRNVQYDKLQGFDILYNVSWDLVDRLQRVFIPAGITEWKIPGVRLDISEYIVKIRTVDTYGKVSKWLDVSLEPTANSFSVRSGGFFNCSIKFTDGVITLPDNFTYTSPIDVAYLVSAGTDDQRHIDFTNLLTTAGDEAYWYFAAADTVDPWKAAGNIEDIDTNFMYFTNLNAADSGLVAAVGTVNTEQGSTIISGVGTSFTSDTVRGSLIKIGTSFMGTVSRVNSDTELLVNAVVPFTLSSQTLQVRSWASDPQYDVVLGKVVFDDPGYSFIPYVKTTNVSSYFHVKYSANASGDPMTDTPDTYIGVLSDSSEWASTTYTDYTWSQLEGTDGVGIPGENAYLHIKYSDDGSSFTTDTGNGLGEDVGAYIGVLSDNVISDSTIFAEYTWSLTKGETGTSGDSLFTATVYMTSATDPGSPTAVGSSYNFTTMTLVPPSGWVVVQPDTSSTPTWACEYIFAGPAGSTVDGTGSWGTTRIDAVAGEGGNGDSVAVVEMYLQGGGTLPTSTSYDFATGIVTGTLNGWVQDMPTVTSSPMYMTTCRFIATYPTTTTSNSSWTSEIIIAQNGTPSYLHIRYSVNATGNPMQTTSASYIGVLTNSVAAASTDYLDYEWSKMEGADGDGSYFHIKYSDDGTSFTADSGSGIGEDVGTWMGTYTDNIAADSTSFSAYTWALIKGEDAWSIFSSYDNVYFSNNIRGIIEDTSSFACEFRVSNGNIVYAYDDAATPAVDTWQFGSVLGTNVTITNTGNILHMTQATSTFATQAATLIGSVSVEILDNLDSSVISTKTINFSKEGAKLIWGFNDTNSNHTFFADSTGDVTDSTSFSCAFSTFLTNAAYPYSDTGVLGDSSYRFSSVVGTNVTPVVNTTTGEVTINSSSALLSGLIITEGSIAVTLMDNYDGNDLITKVITLSKSVAGTDGSTGISGVRGGSVFTFEESYSGVGTSDPDDNISATDAFYWSTTLTDTAAQNVAAAVIACPDYDGYIRPNDRITVSDNSSNYAGTRIYTGTATSSAGSVSEVSFGPLVVEIFDGSVIVDGTLSANAIATDSVLTNNINISSRMTLGSSGGTGIISSPNKSSMTDDDNGVYIDTLGNLYLGTTSGGIKWDGTTLSVKGNVQIAPGSEGYSNLGDAPSDLSELDSTANDKLGTIAEGADITNYDDYRVTNIETDGSILTVARPVGGSYSSSTSILNGAIIITLPQSWTATMMKFEVDVFNYSTSGIRSFTLKLGGYNYTAGSAWVNEFAQMIGYLASNNRVRFGHDGTKCCIVIGEVTADGVASTWNYPKVVVSNFQAGYSNYAAAQWATGWSIGVTDDLTGYVFTGDFADALLDAKSILGQGALATQDSADYSTDISGTKPPAGADVTATALSNTVAIDSGGLRVTDTISGNYAELTEAALNFYRGGVAYKAIKRIETGSGTSGTHIAFSPAFVVKPNVFMFLKSNMTYDASVPAANQALLIVADNVSINGFDPVVTITYGTSSGILYDKNTSLPNATDIYYYTNTDDATDQVTRIVTGLQGPAVVDLYYSLWEGSAWGTESYIGEKVSNSITEDPGAFSSAWSDYWRGTTLYMKPAELNTAITVGGNTAADYGTGAGTITLPTNTTGDMVIICCAGDTDNWHTTGSGATNLWTADTDVFSWCDYIIVDGGAVSSYTWTGGTAPDQDTTVIAFTLHNVDLTDPFGTPYTHIDGSTGMPNPPAITGVKDNGGMIIALGFLDDDKASGIIAPTGYSGIISWYRDGSNNSTVMAAFKSYTYGATEISANLPAGRYRIRMRAQDADGCVLDYVKLSTSAYGTPAAGDMVYLAVEEGGSV